MHHLLNEFRPHQARESLRVMMEMQKRQRDETTTRLQEQIKKIRSMTNKAFASLTETVEVNTAPTDSRNAVDKDLSLLNRNGCTPDEAAMCEIVDSMFP